VEDIPLDRIVRVTSKGLLGNRVLTLHHVDGARDYLHIIVGPFGGDHVTGQKAFLDEAPKYINARRQPTG
jgi:hypothetical protein